MIRTRTVETKTETEYEREVEVETKGRHPCLCLLLRQMGVEAELVQVVVLEIRGNVKEKGPEEMTGREIDRGTVYYW